jgi:hypothetical protein
MNGNDIYQKYSTRFGVTAESAQASDSDDAENLGVFGYVRGRTDRAEMLELKKRTGNIRAVSYSWIQKVDFDPSSGITIYAGDETITIRGRNLNSGQQTTVLAGIIKHRALWIVESDQSALLQADKSAAVVESIQWT